MSYLSDLLGGSYHEGMSEEEISSALESVHTSNIETLKNALSKANSEAAEYKRQLRGRQTAEEAAQAEQKALMERLTEENTSLKKNIAVSQRTTELLGLGYNADLASATALAMIEGDLDTVVKNQAAFIEAKTRDIVAGQMKNTPRPVSGSAGGDHYQKLIEEARGRGDLSAVAYYTRISQEVNHG